MITNALAYNNNIDISHSSLVSSTLQRPGGLLFITLLIIFILGFVFRLILVKYILDKIDGKNKTFWKLFKK